MIGGKAFHTIFTVLGAQWRLRRSSLLAGANRDDPGHNGRRRRSGRDTTALRVTARLCPERTGLSGLMRCIRLITLLLLSVIIFIFRRSGIVLVRRRVRQINQLLITGVLEGWQRRSRRPQPILAVTFRAETNLDAWGVAVGSRVPKPGRDTEAPRHGFSTGGFMWFG